MKKEEFILVVWIMTTMSCLAGVEVDHLRCEYQENPLGIGCEAPRLSWVLKANGRGVKQTAYQIVVEGAWDSGIVESGESVNVAYAGKPLASGMRYAWKVRAWDQDGRPSSWSESASWTMEMLSPEEWRAHWIAMPGNKDMPTGMDLRGAQWIWGIPAGETALEASPGSCRLSRTFNVPKVRVILDAQLMVSADNSATIELNGKTVAEVTDWVSGRIVNVKDVLVSGKNELSVLAVNGGDGPNPAGMICKLRIQMADGIHMQVVSDGQWSAAANDQSNKPNQVSEVAPWGQGPWGANVRFKESHRGEGLPVFRKTFVADGTLKRALVNVSGLGHYELFLNGRKVGPQFLAPAWSVYRKTIYYNSFDITGLLIDGANEFRIMLGKGFYNTRGDRRVHGVNSRGELMTILEARLAYADGKKEWVVTDDTWDVACGPIKHCAILAGSDFDARAAEPSEWMKAVQTKCAGTLRAAESPAMKAFARRSPVKAPEEPETGVFVYDFGENLSALPFISVRGQKGQTVRITPAEQRHGQTDRHNNGTGRVNQAGVGSPNYCEYTLNGSGLESWQPQFTYGGFQYLEITGAVPKGHPNPQTLPVLEELQSVHVRSSVKQVGAFACSNPLFVNIDEAIDRAVRSNLAHVLTDCPTREKLGWLEVAYLMGPSISRRYDLSRLYAKITRDIRDSQGEEGAMYTVAPNYPEFRGGFRYTPEWGAAGVIVPWQLYRWYGDERVLKDNLQAMKSFVDYMETTSQGLVPKAGLGDWYDYGHGKGSGHAKFTPPELSGMATFYRCTTIVAKTAGDVGFHYLVEALGRYSCSETVYKILDRHDEGSYGFIMDRGWTALPEAWDAKTSASMNHCMLGHVQQWFYCDILGIKQASDSVGFRKIIIKPAFETDLEWAKGHYDSVNGRIHVDWTKKNGRLSLNVTIPENTTAAVYVPVASKPGEDRPAEDAVSITESGQTVDRVQAVKFLRIEEGRAVFETGSGTYEFSSAI